MINNQPATREPYPSLAGREGIVGGYLLHLDQRAVSRNLARVCMSVMTPTASHQAGNSRREQLTSALVVGGVLVLLGAASGLGIEVTSSAAPLPKALPSKAVTLPTLQPNTSGPTPVNYIGTPGPGNLPTIYPGGVVVATSGPSTLPQARRGRRAVPRHRARRQARRLRALRPPRH